MNTIEIRIKQELEQCYKKYKLVQSINWNKGWLYDDAEYQPGISCLTVNDTHSIQESPFYLDYSIHYPHDKPLGNESNEYHIKALEFRLGYDLRKIEIELLKKEFKDVIKNQYHKYESNKYSNNTIYVIEENIFEKTDPVIDIQSSLELLNFTTTQFYEYFKSNRSILIYTTFKDDSVNYEFYWMVKNVFPDWLEMIKKEHYLFKSLVNDQKLFYELMVDYCIEAFYSRFAKDEVLNVFYDLFNFLLNFDTIRNIVPEVKSNRNELIISSYE